MAKRLGSIRLLFLASALLFAAGCQAQLYDNLSEAEANSVMAALLDAGIAAEKSAGTEGTFRVLVEEGDFARAMAVLDAKALPRKRHDNLGKVFGKEAMFSTPMEEKARFLYAMQEDIANTLSSIDGVLEARIHLVLPEQDQLGRNLQIPSAAVFIRHVDDERHDPIAHRTEIRRLVAAALPNLDEDRIVVSFFPVSPLPDAVPALRHRSLLGIQVAEASVSRFIWLLAGGGLLCAVLAVLAVLGWTRGRRAGGKKA